MSKIQKVRLYFTKKSLEKASQEELKSALYSVESQSMGEYGDVLAGLIVREMDRVYS